jgi:uncharacterized protein (DUF983 family)
MSQKLGGHPRKSIRTSLWGAITNVCPRCFKGQVFSGMFRMHAQCPECRLVFEREQGYFLGATSFSYIFGFIAILPILLYMLWRQAPLIWTVALPGIFLCILSPALFKYSRLVWLHLDFRFSPSED